MSGKIDKIEIDLLKLAAARKALDFLEDGMQIGIGTGSTAEQFIRLLAERVAEGLKISGVATSERSEALCTKLGVPMISINEAPELNVTVDGADEIDKRLRLIKGGGGALLREKIVASASNNMIVIADETKWVEQLGAFPLPIEITRFGYVATMFAIEKSLKNIELAANIQLRQKDGAIVKTDGGNYIVDASFSHISQPEELSRQLHEIPGVVEHGLFLGLATRAIIAMHDGSIKVFEATSKMSGDHC